MGYMELKGTDRAINQALLQNVLDHQDVITMIIVGPDQAEAARLAKELADNEPSTWWVIWIQNPMLLTDEQRKSYFGAAGKKVACVLSRSDKVVRQLSKAEAGNQVQLLEALWEAEESQ